VDLDRVAVVVQRDGVGAAGVVLDARPPVDHPVGEVNDPDPVEEPVGADMDFHGVAVVVEGDGVGAAGVVLDARPPVDRLVGEVDDPDPVEEPVGADVDSTAWPWSSRATALGPPVSYWMLGPQSIVWLVKSTIPTR